MKINNLSLIIGFLILLIFFPKVIMGQNSVNPEFKRLVDGTYEGTYKKDTAKADVEVLIINGRIESITPIKHWSGRRKVAQTIGQRIVEKQQTQVDAVTEVTVTSVAVMKAVENALEKAAAKAKEISDIKGDVQIEQ